MKKATKIFQNNNWQFNQYVTKIFDAHVKQSIPFYSISHDLTVKLSEFFLKTGSNYYDIGCSTGTLLKKIKKSNKKLINYIGIDDSKDMILSAKKNLKGVKFFKSKAENFKFKKSDLITALYTLQFNNYSQKKKILSKIYKSLNTDGAFIVFEKVRFENSKIQEIFNSMYYDFKLNKKISAIEILKKEKSLRGIMTPIKIEENIALFKRSGFKNIYTISQYLFFIGFICIK